MRTWYLKLMSGFFGGVALGLFLGGAVFAADLSADSLKFAAGVAKAPEGYETPASSYVVANPTSVFANHFYFDSKVTGELKRGERVEALAKVKGYDWVLVGKKGMGIGYVPISMLAPDNQYHS
jgi:hypothetical protein